MQPMERIERLEQLLCKLLRVETMEDAVKFSEERPTAPYEVKTVQGTGGSGDPDETDGGKSKAKKG